MGLGVPNGVKVTDQTVGVAAGNSAMGATAGSGVSVGGGMGVGVGLLEISTAIGPAVPSSGVT